jgi:diguanylate cyclase (GGDEF)-like protein/PAS domain S-box-containing protein
VYAQASEATTDDRGTPDPAEPTRSRALCADPSHDLFRELAVLGDDLVTWHDVDGRVLFASDAAGALLGAPPGEVVGHSLGRWCHPDDRQVIVDAGARAVVERDGSFEPVTWRAIRPDGAVTYIDSRVRVRTDPVSGAVVGFVGYSRDVTTMVDHAEALRANEERWRALADSAPIGIFAADADGRCTYANDRSETIYGRPVDEVLGMPLLDGVHADDRRRVARAWGVLMTEGVDLDVELRIVQPGGDERWCRLKGSRIEQREHDGTIAVGSLEDVTDARAARLAAQAAEARFRATFDSAPIGMAVLTGEGHLEQQNPAWRLVSGSSIPHPAPQLSSLFADEHVAAVDDAVETVRAQQTPTSLDGLEIHRDDGTSRWVQLHLSSLPPSPGDTLHLLAQLVDLTARRDLEQQLRTLADLDPLTGMWNRRSFERYLDELAERRRASDRGVMLMIDLDRFKAVNDSLGHRTGDEVLAGIAGALRDRLRDGDVIARLGGDEFAVALVGNELDDAIVVAEALLEAVAAYSASRTTEAEQLVSASIGMAAWHGGDDPAEVLARADVALYEAKSAGRNQWAVARPSTG